MTAKRRLAHLIMGHALSISICFLVLLGVWVISPYLLLLAFMCIGAYATTGFFAEFGKFVADELNRNSELRDEDV